ncbi:MAG: FAD-dependent oxidoreductase [Cyclobacteriaceae bacterium]|nr:MAG: FAD-dependent oxidoreductase [Cyclobacteriaceae bacterium]
MRRRKFLEACGMAGTGLLSTSFQTRNTASSRNRHTAGISADVIIVGGGMGACAAAMAACRLGASVIITEPTDWIGGQVSQQGVPPDEHRWIETTPGTASYARYRSLIREYYRQFYPLTDTAREQPLLNPGNGAVSRICHEPKVSLAVLQGMLAPHLAAGNLNILLQTAPVSALVLDDHIKSIICTDHLGRRYELQAKIFIDASEEGDLLPITGTEYVIGAESQGQTGEPNAPATADPANIQAFTYCFAIDHMDGEDHTIDRPEWYDFWKDYVPDLTPPWSGPLLSLAYSYPRTLAPKTLPFIPCTKTQQAPSTDDLNLWLYRRLIDRDNFKAGAFTSDISLINWPQNDYMLGNITDVSGIERQKHLYQAKQLSLSLLYWLQTEAPKPDGKPGWKGLRLRKDVMGTSDGLAKYPYIRESRRIKAEFTILEQHLTLAERQKQTQQTTGQILALPFLDTVGIGYYHLDLHPSTGGDNYIDTASVPFQIPLGALIPERMENLIAGCKNIGTTHISNGCYRLHPVEWSIGEAAGTLAAHAINRKILPRKIRNDGDELVNFQQLLLKNGVDLEWRF